MLFECKDESFWNFTDDDVDDDDDVSVCAALYNCRSSVAMDSADYGCSGGDDDGCGGGSCVVVVYIDSDGGEQLEEQEDDDANKWDRGSDRADRWMDGCWFRACVLEWV